MSIRTKALLFLALAILATVLPWEREGRTESLQSPQRAPGEASVPGRTRPIRAATGPLVNQPVLQVAAAAMQRTDMSSDLFSGFVTGVVSNVPATPPVNATTTTVQSVTGFHRVRVE